MSIRTVGLITARGGSKRLPGKALLECAGRPMIDWTIAAAHDSGHVDELVLSTDDPMIAEHCRALGVSVPFMRPAELATDGASSIDVIVHAIAEMGWSVQHLLLLQPTSPARAGSDIANACDLAASHPEASIMSVTRLDHPLSWLWQDDGARRKLADSYTLPPDNAVLYRPNGAVYMRRADKIAAERLLISEADCVFYEMPKLRSVDVDTRDDLDLADQILRAGGSGAIGHE